MNYFPVGEHDCRKPPVNRPIRVEKVSRVIMPLESREFERFKHGDWYGYEDNLAMEIDTRFSLRNGVGGFLRSPIGLGLEVGVSRTPELEVLGAQSRGAAQTSANLP